MSELRQKGILHMQIRLFRLAWMKWGVGLEKCAEWFDRFQVDRYISECYEIFHVQGDEANLGEVARYLKSQGAEL